MNCSNTGRGSGSAPSRCFLYAANSCVNRRCLLVVVGMILQAPHIRLARRLLLRTVLFRRSISGTILAVQSLRSPVRWGLLTKRLVDEAGYFNTLFHALIQDELDQRRETGL